MFRRLISNLSFSPSLVGQLSFYARRLRKEEVSRKAGLILTALMLIVQSFAVFVPPESANAASRNDFVAGGINKLEEYLQLYDSNSRSLRDILTAAGISRNELAAAKATTYEPASTFIYSRTANLNDNRQRAFGYQKSDGNFGTIYGQPHAASQPKNGWANYSQTLGWFAVDKSSGNLVTESYLESPLILPTVTYSKQARNLTTGATNAGSQIVRGGDKIQYHLTATNTGASAVEAPITDRLNDVLEYAQLVDTGGGNFDSDEQTLSWSAMTLQPGESQSRAFMVQLIDPVPASPRGATDSTSYDCVMSNSAGNTVDLTVACPQVKAIESLSSTLPPLSLSTNLIFAAGLLALTIYFYARSRQLQTEIRIIRRDLNAGTF